MSGEHYLNLAPMMDTKDLFVRIGFCPDFVKLTAVNTGLQFYWNSSEHGHYQGAASSLGIAVAAAGSRALTTTNGIKLVKFTSAPIDTVTDPSGVDSTNWHEANGIKIDSAVVLLADDALLQIEAWRNDFIWLKCYHDGGDGVHTYFRDLSYDFKELGVCGNGQWLIYNQTNGNYAYVKELRRNTPGGKFTRIYTATDEDGAATTAADFDDDDVCYLFKREAACYPLSDVVIMT